MYVVAQVPCLSEVCDEVEPRYTTTWDVGNGSDKDSDAIAKEKEEAVTAMEYRFAEKSPYNDDRSVGDTALAMMAGGEKKSALPLL